MDQEHVNDLRAAWEAKADIPALLVFKIGERYRLADGYHRLAGAKLANRSSVPCEVRQGTVRDAWLAAIQANRDHLGLRRTNADKRRVVMQALGDDELVKWSDHRIAEYVGVGNSFVGNIRKELSTVDSSPAAKTKDEPKIGKDGKARKAPQNGKKTKTTGVDFGIRSKPVEEPQPEPIPEVVPIDPNDFNPANIEAHNASFAANFAAKVKAHNLDIERFARSIMEAFADPPASVWLDESRLGIALDQIKSACATIRQAKAHDKPCPKCDGKGSHTGKPCKWCKGVGYMPERSYEMAGGQ